MKWSNELPKAPGWYWCKFNETIRVMQIVSIGGDYLYTSSQSPFSIPKNQPWQFSGPIPEPEEE